MTVAVAPAGRCRGSGALARGRAARSQCRLVHEQKQALFVALRSAWHAGRALLAVRPLPQRQQRRQRRRRDARQPRAACAQDVVAGTEARFAQERGIHQQQQDNVDIELGEALSSEGVVEDTSEAVTEAAAEAADEARCRCAAGAGNAWLEHEDFWSLAFTAGLEASDTRWMNAFERLCTEEGCDLNVGVCGEVFVRLVMDELVVRCQRTGESLRTMLRLLRPSQVGGARSQVHSCAPQMRSRAGAASSASTALEPVLEVGSVSECAEASRAPVAEMDLVSVDEAFELARLEAQAATEEAHAVKIAQCLDPAPGDLDSTPAEAVGGKETATASRATCQAAEVQQQQSPKRARERSRRNAEEERFLGELDKFKLTARAKPSPSSKRSMKPAPFDPLIELDTIAVPTVDQDWQTMLQDVFEMELQGSSLPSGQ